MNSQNQNLHKLSFQIQQYEFLWKDILGKSFLVFCISFVDFFHENKWNLFELQFCYFILVFELKIFFFYLSIESFNHIIVNISIIAIIATPI